MPKKTRLQKIRAAQHTASVVSSTPSLPVNESESEMTKSIKSDMLKSILLSCLITVFEIALYFVYYQRVWERR